MSMKDLLHVGRKSVAGITATVLFGSMMTLSAPQAFAEGSAFAGSKITYWGGRIFSQEANQHLVDAITAWGEANDVETEVVMINNNEMVAKVSAAVASGTLPDAIDVNIDLLLLMSRQGIFADLGDVYDRIGEAQGGWYESVAAASDLVANEVGRTGLPYGVTGNMILRRTDLLSAAGFDKAPATWDEIADQAAAVVQPPVFGLGLALSNVADANVQIAVMQAFGGRIADDAGKVVTIKSDETRAYLAWLKSAWDRGVFPPGVATWDGGGDNQAYLSGQAAFIANTGSVSIQSRTNDPELYDATAYSPLPAGPVRQVSPIIMAFRAVPASGDNVEAAKALLEYLAQPEFAGNYYSAAIYGPVLRDQAGLAAFDGEDPIRAGLLNLVETGSAPAYPDVYNAAFAELFTSFIIPKMAQRVVIDGWDFDAAMDEAQQQAEAIYAKY